MKKLSKTMLILLLVCVLCSTAAGRQASVIVQASPPDGGTVTPGLVVHDADIDSDFSLQATPKPGYQFVYWLGDVSDSASSSTSAYVDSPKIVVAVFEKAQFDFVDMQPAPVEGAGGGGSRLTPNRGLGNTAVTGGAGQKDFGHDVIYNFPELPDDNGDDDNDNEDPPVPEPATIFLIGSGAFALLKRKKGR